MKITIKELLNSRTALEGILGEKLPPKIGFTVQWNARQIEQEMQVYEDQRIAIIKELGEETPSGGWQIPQDNKEALAEFNERHGELMEMEVDVNLRMIDEGELVSQLEKYDLLITGLDWLRIGYMIAEKPVGKSRKKEEKA